MATVTTACGYARWTAAAASVTAVRRSVGWSPSLSARRSIVRAFSAVSASASALRSMALAYRARSDRSSFAASNDA
ncbi:hypothetical protein [Halarchaeum acidiphilum]|uniref:hypothetical protein n=1 Tax=Halarchaeum acidiphilum TaxID=489138 RepID=UPI00131F26EE|nr:hypothetical protein [Halarchaeum acidiphilum]